jgi:hypothetical protein
MEITAPAGVAGPCTAAAASFGPVFGQTPVTGTAVVAIDEANDDGPSTTDGCTAYTNAAEVDGGWAYVDRGTCTFAVKAQNAEAAGAIGIVVGDNVAGRAPIPMSGVSDLYGVMVTLEDGARFKSAGEPVSFEIAAVEAETDDTYRWLSGESDPAFGGAIRDLWNPNCYGDPGRVSDEEYHCAPDDSGGVHTNSGVVNRTFAIMVDGYEPSGVDAIGLDKAANLFWHTQTNFLTPTSGFAELADGLEASCAALTGVDIPRMTLGDPTEADGSDGAATPEVIEGGLTAADCAEVSAAIAETELRAEPVQCNFQPMLKQGTLTCGDGFTTDAVWTEDFEDGLDGWTQDFEFGNYGGIGFPQLGGAVHHPWVTTTDMPVATDRPGDAGTHPPSTVVYGPDPTTGSCAGDENDESSRDGLISPVITVPDGAAARLQFDHLVATEAGWDGGNVKYSLDGGETFVAVPSHAWLFNAPHGQLETAGAGNSNPLAGQTAFTGTDGGESTGSWGTSVIDLGNLGAHAGDEIQFRFDMGRDGCNGVDGWYLDDIQVTVCEEEVEEPEALPTTTKVTSVKPNPVKKGKPFKVTVKVGASGDTPNGVVKIKKGDRVLGKGTLKANGTVVITVQKKLSVGRHTLVAAYVGNDSFKASKDRFQVRVVK